MKIVIANSIGIDKDNNFIIHSPSRWSEGVKSKENIFTYYPWELAYLSALLKEKTEHNIKFVDGCLLSLNQKQYQELIAKEKPEILIMESSSRVIEENLNLALNIKKQFGTELIFCGQHATAKPAELLEKGCDLICLGEYEETILEIIQGKNKAEILGLYPNPRRPLLDVNTLPFPEDDDVSRFAYAVPGEPSSEFKEIQMYASRGCTMSCAYCVARNVYYDKPNFRPRNVDSIVEEIIYLKEKYPQLEGIFFDEEEHNGERNFALSLADAIYQKAPKNLRYEAMCNFSKLDKEQIIAYKKAGYYKLRGGIETASSLNAKHLNRALNLEKIKENLLIAKQVGLKMYGTFMFGLPSGDFQEELKTIDFMKSLIKQKLLSNVQISILTPLPGTPLYNLAKRNNYLTVDDYAKLDGGLFYTMRYPNLSEKDIEKLHKYALNSRNHLFLYRNLKKNLFAKISDNIRKRGVVNFGKKAITRIWEEVSFLKNKNIS